MLGINPYKTKYHFKACKQPNFDNVGFSPLKCWDDNWAEREKYLICFFNQFKCACVLLFLQTIFGKSINTGWFLIDIFLKSFKLFKFKYVILYFWPWHLSQKCFAKSKFGHKIWPLFAYFCLNLIFPYILAWTNLFMVVNFCRFCLITWHFWKILSLKYLASLR